MRASVAFILLACVGVAISNEEGDEEIHFTNSWAVHIDNEDLEAANAIATKHGFVNQGQVANARVAYLPSFMAYFRLCKKRYIFWVLDLFVLGERYDRSRPLTRSWCLIMLERYQKPYHVSKINIAACGITFCRFVKQIGSLPGYYHFVKNTVGERSRRSLDDHSQTLLKEPKVGLSCIMCVCVASVWLIVIPCEELVGG